jgi:hypothetical protein
MNDLTLTIFKCDKKINIFAPIGGFGNHLRWLLMLDSSFSFSIAPPKDQYLIFSGSEWPTYENFIINNYQCSESIKLEIENCIVQSDLPRQLIMTDLDNKLCSTLASVYTEQRTWHNWLTHEWMYRNHLNQIVTFNHEPIPGPVDDITKTIGLIIDPDFALKTYLKFNTSLSGLTHGQFKQYIEKMCQEIKNYSTINKNTLILEAESLFTESLNPTIYSKIIDWLELENNYHSSNIVHSQWFKLQKKSEKEFVRDITKIYQEK